MREILISFLEAQCFFVLTTGTALLTTIRGKGRLLNATSLIQDQANLLIIIVTALISGIVTGSTLILVHILDRLSVYIAILTAASQIISAILFARSDVFMGSINENDIYSNDMAVAGVQNISSLRSCCYNPPPNTYCGILMGSDNQNILPGSLTESAVVETLIIRLICPTINGIIFLYSMVLLGTACSEYLRGFDSFHPKIQKVLEAIRGNVHVSLVFFSFLWIMGTGLLLLLLAILRRRMISTDWGIGQIIAVAIWAPLIVRILYWAVGKPPTLTPYIPNPHFVVKVLTTNYETDTLLSPHRDPNLQRAITFSADTFMSGALQAEKLDGREEGQDDEGEAIIGTHFKITRAATTKTMTVKEDEMLLPPAIWHTITL